MTVDLNIFHGKSVFITGHTGFKGAWLAFWLKELGAKVTGFALPPYYPKSFFEILGLDQCIKHIEGDILDDVALEKAMREANPEFVFHLAAQGLVRKSYQEPRLTFATNVMGSVNVLEAVRNVPSVRSLVYITSDKCYWNNEWYWGYRENDTLGGIDPYSASKASAEHVFKSYFLSYLKDRANFGCGSARAGNVIGGGDRAQDRIVPDIIRSLESNQDIMLRNPNATRPWQHVLEPLYGYLTLATKLYNEPKHFNGESWNFGPGDTGIRTVENIAQEIINIWGRGRISIAPSSSLHEATLLYLSIDKAVRLLGWKPKLNFQDTIKMTGSWYKACYQNENMLDVTRQQLERFVNL